MSAFSTLASEYFPLLFFVCFVWVLGVMAWLLWRRRQRGMFREPLQDVLYEEKFASGRSQKSWYTRLGGATNCLRLVVTRSELCVTPIFPFSAFAEAIDLDHRIPLRSIRSLSAKSLGRGKGINLLYDGINGDAKGLELIPKHMDRFTSALREAGVRVDAI